MLATVWECFTSGGQELKLEDKISFPKSEPIFSYDWMDTGDGCSPILAIGAGTKMHLYTHLTTAIFQPRSVQNVQVLLSTMYFLVPASTTSITTTNIVPLCHVYSTVLVGLCSRRTEPLVFYC